jgi:AraC-like DNA-binding protein
MTKATIVGLIKPVLNELEARNGALSASEAAQLMNLGKRRFRYEFTRHTGINFRTARVRAKLARAQSLLLTTDLSIPDISEQLGYSDRTKFERMFKRLYGATPTQYRLKENRATVFTKIPSFS